MGSDGTVGANKQAIKLAVTEAGLKGQAYFAYSADKSNAVTRSFLRFGKDEITSSYLVQNADYIACHKSAFVHKVHCDIQLEWFFGLSDVFF